MTQRRVFFATNRRAAPGGGFDLAPDPPADRLWLGALQVGCSPDPMEAGACGPAETSGDDDFAAPGGGCSALLAAWLAEAEAKDAIPLLSVHGFAYSFQDACARAGNLCDWLEAPGGIRLVPLVFTWPSLGDTSTAAYPIDQRRCAEAGPALARLVRAIAGAATLHQGRKPAWIAHSMGARATRCAMQALAAGGEVPQGLFGQALVMAGDEERDVLRPGTGAMRPLLALADWTTIGIYPQDGTLTIISKAQNGTDRLGADGPDTVLDPAERCFVVSYARAVDLKPDAVGVADINYVAHQYYRNDPRVRRDMVAALLGGSPAAVEGRRWGQPDPSVFPRERADWLYVREA